MTEFNDIHGGLAELQGRLGYKFKNQALLRTALTHSSYSADRSGGEDNERLEFIGDGFLDAVIGAELFDRLPRSAEGKLTKLRALVVCEKALASVAKDLDLGSYLYMGHGEETAGGRKKDSILADAVEAIIGAVYLDSGFQSAKELILGLLEDMLKEAMDGKLFSDYKSKIQELVQSKGGRQTVVYKVDREEGPPHDKTFFVSLYCGRELLGYGRGKNKKEAEQSAAKAAIAVLERRK